MDFVRPFVKPVPPDIAAAPGEIDRLVGLLADRPAEIEFRQDGAFLHGGHVDGCDRIAAVLARRNIRSLLARVPNASNIRTAIGLALTGDPEDAEDALEEAGIELNLRLSLFATSEARLSMDGGTLTIEGDRPPACILERRDYHDAGRDVFCAEALFRLLYSRIDCVRYSPELILPMPRQLVMMAAMDSESPGLAAGRVDARARRKPHFEKQFCSACGRCVFICLNDAVERAETAPSAAGPAPRTGTNADRCVACGLCAAYCQGDAHGRKAIVMIRADADGTPDMHEVS